MKTILIAPVPPPITGNSLAVKIFQEELEKYGETTIVNLSKDSFINGMTSGLGRIRQIFRILREVRQKRKGADILYFTISESIAGNLKDLLIYLICYSQLPNMIIHLHGGAGMRLIMQKKNSLLFKLNRFFLKRLGGIIVLGKSHTDIYADIVPPEKLHIVPNFAEDYLFLSEDEIRTKFLDFSPVRFLFLSNLIEGKGHIELVEAFKMLTKQQKNVQIDFAGGFESEEKKLEFLAMLDGYPQLKYHGTVNGEAKKQLFQQAHVFCLPTYYPYEGQPISILEAYATGCMVITTNHSGIRDTFSDGVNGIEVEKRSASSLKSAMEYVTGHTNMLIHFAMTNRKIAGELYVTSIYNNSLLNVFRSIYPIQYIKAPPGQY